jgi:predicted PurR-regulated permease PerM
MRRSQYYNSLMWSALGALFIGFLILINKILLPFVVAFIVAYFLNPPANYLEKFLRSRALATISICAIFFTIVAGICITLLPLLYKQMLHLLEILPGYVKTLSENYLPTLQNNISRFSPEAASEVQSAIGGSSTKILGFISNFAIEMWSSGFAVLNIISLLVLTPIVTFYILRDWNRLLKKISSWLPPLHAEVIREQCRLIDQTLAGYIRGQTNVCLLLGVFYGAALSLVGLKFGFLIGLLSGLFSFVPFVGVLVGFVIAMILGFVQFGDADHLLMIAGVFAVGQFLEGNFITPKLIGDRVGLHPVWVIFGMLSGAALFGVVGILLAVPITAVLGVLLRFLVARYLESSLYRGIQSSE